MLISDELAPSCYPIAQTRNLGLSLSTYLSILVFILEKFSFLSILLIFFPWVSSACSDGDGHLAKNCGQPSTHSQLGTEAFGPTAQKELRPARQPLSELKSRSCPNWTLRWLQAWLTPWLQPYERPWRRRPSKTRPGSLTTDTGRW